MGVWTILDDRFRKLVQGNAQVEVLGEGFRWLEGPTWFGDHRCLVFSDIPHNRIMRWSQNDGISVFREPAGFANGHARDRQGRLISCSHHDRCITRTEYDGTITVLADRHDGKRLNAPNDVIVKSDGTIWFSDPVYGLQSDYEGGKQHSEQPARFYRLDPKSGRLAIASDAFTGPNGLAFSPDESVLYAAETGDQFAASPDRAIYRMAIGKDGLPGKREKFATVSPGYCDGFTVDIDGNVWSSAGDGVHVFAPDGALIGKIETGCVVSNLCFGDRHNARLFMAAGQRLLSIFTNTRGAVSP